MAEKLDPQDLVTLDERAISTMWETSALVVVLERGSTRRTTYPAVGEAPLGLDQLEPSQSLAHGFVSKISMSPN